MIQFLSTPINAATSALAGAGVGGVVALIKAKVAEADANQAPGIPMAEVFDGLRN